MVASLSSEANWALHVAAAAATAAGLYAAYATGRRGALVNARHNTHKKAFVLMVSLAFKDAKAKQKWLAEFEKMVAHVRANEPDTLSYELLESDSDPLSLVVYERYVDRAAYEEVHRTSAPMAAFKAATAGVKVAVAGQTYLETNVGFM